MKLAIDEAATSGMTYKDATTSIVFDGDALKLITGGATKACKFVSRSLPPPVAAGVVRDIKAEDAGASVEMKVGEKISVSLSGVPTAGYVWSADNPPAFVKVARPGGQPRHRSPPALPAAITGSVDHRAPALARRDRAGAEAAMGRQGRSADERFRFKLTGSSRLR
jgi:hypothetical protein